MATRIYTSEDFGAPAHLSATSGVAIAILDACLIDGYGSQTVTITRSGTTVTVVCDAAHGFLATNMYTISGADQAEYNGDHRVTVVDAMTLSFQLATTPTTPATGTLTGKQVSAGWTKPYSGTNLASYKQGLASKGRYLHVDDTGTEVGRVRGYEAMSAISTGVGAFPTVPQEANNTWMKADAGQTLEWIVIADEHFVIWIASFNDDPINNSVGFFGDVETLQPGDEYNTMIVGSSYTTASTTHANGGALQLLSTSVASVLSGHYIAREHGQLGSSLQVAVTASAEYGTSYTGCTLRTPYPNPTDNGLYLAQLIVHEGTGTRRGAIPITYNPLQQRPLGLSVNTFEGSGEFDGKTFLYIPCYSAASMIFDIGV